MPVPTYGLTWARSGTSAETRVTWSFADRDLESRLSFEHRGYPDFDRTIASEWRPLIRQAFEAWDRVSGVDFVEVNDSVDSDIRLGQAFIDGTPVRGASSTLGTAQWWTVGTNLEAAAITLDEDAFSSQSVLYWTVLHEIGHAIGLDHSTAGSDIMSAYLNAGVMGLTRDDIAAAQSLYGADPLGGRSPPPSYVLDVARLYEAALNRPFDTTGLNFWIDRHESGQTLPSMASFFLDSAEFTSRFGDDDRMQNEQFIQLLYANVLDRAPDAGGLSYWANAMASGQTRETVLTGFAVSPENVNNTVYLAGLSETAQGYWNL